MTLNAFVMGIFSLHPTARVQASSVSTPVMTWPIALQRVCEPDLNAIELPLQRPRLDHRIYRVDRYRYADHS